MRPRLDEIAYHLSSTRMNPNVLMREKVVPFLKQQRVERVLDFGCGRFLRDSLLLAEQGFRVDAVDLESQVDRIDKDEAFRLNNLSTDIPSYEYDAALLNFVLQVIPVKQKREEILDKVVGAVTDSGYLVLSLSSEADLARRSKNKEPYKDGYLMRWGDRYTFARGYSRKQIVHMVKQAGLFPIAMYSNYMSNVAIARKPWGNPWLCGFPV